MEGDRVAVVFIDPGSCNDRPSQIAADIFNDGVRVTFVPVLSLICRLNLFEDTK